MKKSKKKLKNKIRKWRQNCPCYNCFLVCNCTDNCEEYINYFVNINQNIVCYGCKFSTGCFDKEMLSRFKEGKW